MKKIPPEYIVISLILYAAWLFEPFYNVSNAAPCYLYMNGNDSIIMEMTITDKYVNGQLTYNLYEKDKEVGSIAGELHKDTLIADYVFSSGGRNRSIREVVFLVTESALIEGHGEMVYLGDKTIFRNRKTLSFSGNVILKKGNCNDAKLPL
jgi:hypothetical protein